MDPERVERHNGRLYLTGLAASLIGNSAMTLVAGIWVKSLTGSSARAGLVSALMYAPTLAGPAAGMLVDRVDRRRWLVAINLVSAATILSLLGVRSADGWWLIAGAMCVYGLEEVLIGPAEDALFVQIFSDAFRRRINGRRLAIQETGRLVAPLIGAGLFALIGGGAVAALDAATFLVAAAVSARLIVPAPTASAAAARAPARGPAPAGDAEAEPPRARRLASELAAGGRHILADDALRRVTFAGAGVMAVSAVGVAAQFSLVTAVGQRPAFLGVFSAVLGAGSVIAALTSGRVITRVGERGLALAGLANFAAGNLLRATGVLPAALAGTLVLGFALPWAYLAVLNLAQRSTPDDLQGRVSAAVTLAMFGPQAPLQALGSLAISVVGFGVIYGASAVASLALAGWLALATRGYGWTVRSIPSGFERRRASGSSSSGKP
ncbi:MAG TPA: MFS transporter [Solirubrobacteraceae bacterium]|nr:MFS transporter [Solirubrobacteraceae bacterium]